MSTDTSEQGLELLILRSLTGLTDEQIMEASGEEVVERPSGYGGAGYVIGTPEDYEREHAVDLSKLLMFIQETQPSVFEQLGLATDSRKGVVRYRVSRAGKDAGAPRIVPGETQGSGAPRDQATFSSSPKQLQFLNRLQGEIAKRGIVDVLRKGI